MKRMEQSQTTLGPGPQSGSIRPQTAAEYSVGQVSEMLGVSVRTLHHYDEIGLLTPSRRSPSGYRLYDSGDLTRLQHIVVYRRLEFGLEEIRILLDCAAADLEAHLRRQRAAVSDRLDELHALVGAIDIALEAVMTDRPITTEEMKELFGDSFSEDYQAEAEQRWGDTDAWRQSQQRTGRYTKGDWQAVKAEQEAVTLALAAAMDAGLPATSEQAMDAAEQHRRHIHDRFYDLGYDMHRGLADMYLADPRFTAFYERSARGWPSTCMTRSTPTPTGTAGLTRQTWAQRHAVPARRARRDVVPVPDCGHCVTPCPLDGHDVTSCPCLGGCPCCLGLPVLSWEPPSGSAEVGRHVVQGLGEQGKAVSRLVVGDRQRAGRRGCGCR